MSWTPERTDRAIALWKEGYSASQVAEMLGGVTRNAVIGKLKRKGFVGGDAGRVERKSANMSRAQQATPLSPKSRNSSAKRSCKQKG